MFFWYRLTRVFPDKFHRAVKWLLLCVCCVIYGYGVGNTVELNSENDIFSPIRMCWLLQWHVDSSKTLLQRNPPVCNRGCWPFTGCCYLLTVRVFCLGVGTRNYYRKMGYELEGPYMTKLLNPTVDNVCVINRL